MPQRTPCPPAPQAAARYDDDLLILHAVPRRPPPAAHPVPPWAWFAAGWIWATITYLTWAVHPLLTLAVFAALVMWGRKIRNG